MKWRTHILDGKFQVRLMVGFFSTILSKNHSETLFIRLFDTSEFILIDLFSFSRKHKPRFITLTHTHIHIFQFHFRAYFQLIFGIFRSTLFCLPSIYLWNFRLLLFLSFNFPPIFQLFWLMVFFRLFIAFCFIWFFLFFFRFSVEFFIRFKFEQLFDHSLQVFFRQFYHFESYFHAQKIVIPDTMLWKWTKKTWKFDKCIWHKEDSSEILLKKKKEIR